MLGNLLSLLEPTSMPESTQELSSSSRFLCALTQLPGWPSERCSLYLWNGGWPTLSGGCQLTAALAHDTWTPPPQQCQIGLATRHGYACMIVAAAPSQPSLIATPGQSCVNRTWAGACMWWFCALKAVMPKVPRCQANCAG
jgi:hypothetical protein